MEGLQLHIVVGVFTSDSQKKEYSLPRCIIIKYKYYYKQFSTNMKQRPHKKIAAVRTL